MLFSELYEIMVIKVTFVGLRGAIAPPGSAPVCITVTLGPFETGADPERVIGAIGRQDFLVSL